jgi:hypothetical protein
MAVLQARYKVRDRDAFLPVFRDYQPTRDEFGATGHRLLGDPDDPTTVVVHIEFDTVEAARAFAGDPRRHETLARGGVEARDDLVLDEIAEAS